MIQRKHGICAETQGDNTSELKLCQKSDFQIRKWQVPVRKKLNATKEKWIKVHKRTCTYGNNCKDKELLVEEYIERINALENIVMFKCFGKTGRSIITPKKIKLKKLSKCGRLEGR